MPKQSHSSQDKDYNAQAQIDLLEALLEPEDQTYPWNPADPESEAYFAEREQDFLIEEETVTPQTFFTELEQIWSTTTPAADKSTVAAGNSIQTTLPLRFAACVPEGWIETIAHQAHCVFSTHTSIADQLVQCVQELLPNWAREDLLVLARPFAHNMRGTETEALEGVLGNVCTRDWQALSELEQARAGLVIARYVVSQMQHSRS